MSLPGNIGMWLIRRRLQGRPRKVRTINYGQANTVLLLCSFLEKGAENRLKQEVDFLRNQRGITQITVICLAGKKQDVVLNIKAEVTVVRKPDFNWVKIPISKNIKILLSNKYDMLINLSVKENEYLRVLLALSGASMKVGMRKPGENEFLDLGLDLAEQNPENQLLKSINHYLTIINNQKYVA